MLTSNEADDDNLASTYIVDAKYEKATAEEIASKQQHLSQEQQNDLEKIFEKYAKVFDSKLGYYPHAKVHLELYPNSVPVHSRAYAVPQVQEKTFKTELKHLVCIGMLRKCGPTKWASPTFIIPKKDRRVRWISDLRALNKCLKRKVYPLPKINEIVSR